MNAWSGVWTLLQKEVVLEWRTKYALQGILVFVAASVFVAYMSVSLSGEPLTPSFWNGLWWVIVLFSATHAAARSFIQEPEEIQLYLYQLVSPSGLWLAKTVFNMVLLTVTTISGLALYSMVLGFPVRDPLFFMFAMEIGVLGIATALTFISAIASLATKSTTLMAVLGFPVLIPLLLVGNRLTEKAIAGFPRNMMWTETGLLLAINLIILSVSFILFPYLWRR